MYIGCGCCCCWLLLLLLLLVVVVVVVVAAVVAVVVVVVVVVANRTLSPSLKYTKHSCSFAYNLGKPISVTVRIARPIRLADSFRMWESRHKCPYCRK